MVDGVPVHFPHPVRSYSPSTGRSTVELEIPEAGCWTLGPTMALGFSRARKDYQVQDADGTWHTDQGSDLSRIGRQQLFIELAMRRAIAKGARNPNTLRRLVDLGVETVRVDDALEAGDLVALGTRFRSFDPGDLETFTLPVVDDRVGDADVLFLQEDEAEPTLALFRGEDPAAAGGQVDPSGVTVQVRNGTNTEGQAGEVTGALTSAGFATVVPTDAEVGLPTTLLYAEGGEAAAQTVARYLSGPSAYQVSDDLQGADVVVVTGTDWAGVTDAPRPVEEVPGPTTTTTTAPAAEEGGTTTTVGAGDAQVEGDLEDPDTPLFYRAEAPRPGEPCRPTP